MPYIKDEYRESLEPLLAPLCAHIKKPFITEGEVNYVLTRLVLAWVREHPMSYRTLNAALGIFEAAKLEFYRRVVAPYEAEKCAANGDVYAEDDLRGQRATVLPPV